MNLFKLVGSIFIDNEAANNSIAKTDAQAQKTSGSFSKGIKTAAAWGVAITGAAVAAGAAVYKSAESSAKAADEIDKMSQKIGVSREAYQELDFIASQTGTDVSKFQSAVKSLTAAMDGAREGTEENVEQFEKLGIAVTNSDGTFRSQEDVLFDTLEALQGVSDQTEKARLATELFGKSGTELMPLLNSEAGSIEELKAQAHELGLVMDDELIDNGVELSDSLDQTKRAFEAIGVQVGGAFMPLVTQLSDYLQTLLPFIRDSIGQIIPIVVSLAESLVPPFMELVQTVLPLTLDLLAATMPFANQITATILPIIVSLISKLLPVIIQIAQKVLPKVLEMISPLFDLIDPILQLLDPLIDLLLELIDPMMEILEAILPPIIELIIQVADELLPVLTDAINWVCKFITGTVIPVIKTLMDVVIKPAINWLKSFVGTTLSGIVQTIRGTITIITNIVNAIISLIKGDMSGLKNALSQIVAGLRDVLIGTVRQLFASVTTTFSQNKEKLIGIVSSLGEAIKDKFNSVKEFISGVIDKMKSMFDFTFTVPKIKLPHFKVNPPGWTLGDLVKGKIPTLGVEWYAKGGVINNPSVIGMNGNNAMIAGENGAEAIVPLEKNKEWISAVAHDMGAELGMNDKLDRMIELLAELNSNLGSMGVYLDSGAVVGQLAPGMDKALGRLAIQSQRGVYV